MDNIKIIVLNEEIEIPKGMTLLDISKMYQDRFKYPIVLAKVNGQYLELSYKVDRPVDITFYDLTDRTPIKLDMTFPSSIRIKNDIIHSHYIKDENYLLGMTNLELEDGTSIKIYNLERTICDIIRDRNKIDPQIFNTAMKEYSKVKNKNRKYQKYDKMFLTTKTLSNRRYFL